LEEIEELFSAAKKATAANSKVNAKPELICLIPDSKRA